MTGFAAALTLLIGLQAAPPESAPSPEDGAESNVAVVPTAPTSEQTVSPPPLTAPPPPPPPSRRLYGDRGTSELSLGLGYSSYSGFLAAGGFRHFVLPGVAPGIEASYVSGGDRFVALGMVMGALRVVPVRTANVAVVLTGRAGRVLLSDHEDGWGAGGGGGVIIFMGGGAGLELGYEALRLLPARFCATLDGCVIHGPVFGLRLSF